MATTSNFQKTPDFYLSKAECEKAKKKRVNTNPRYLRKGFNQTHFTAGDEDQFQTYRDKSNGEVCIPNISLSRNLFEKLPLPESIYWEKYANTTSSPVLDKV